MVTKIGTQAFVDNKSLVQSVYSTTLVSENRLRVDLAAIQQAAERRQATLKWTLYGANSRQIAWQKLVAPHYKLLDISSMGSYICIQVTEIHFIHNFYCNYYSLPALSTKRNNGESVNYFLFICRFLDDDVMV